MLEVIRVERVVRDRIRALDEELIRLRDLVDEREARRVDTLAVALDRTRERVVSLHERDDDMTDLALRESTRALDEIGDRIRWIRTHTKGESTL